MRLFWQLTCTLIFNQQRHTDLLFEHTQMLRTSTNIHQVAASINTNIYNPSD